MHIIWPSSSCIQGSWIKEFPYLLLQLQASYSPPEMCLVSTGSLIRNRKTEIDPVHRGLCNVWEGDLRANRPTTLLLMCWHNTDREHEEETQYCRTQMDEWTKSFLESFKAANITADQMVFTLSSNIMKTDLSWLCNKRGSYISKRSAVSEV